MAAAADLFVSDFFTDIEFEAQFPLPRQFLLQLQGGNGALKGGLDPHVAGRKLFPQFFLLEIFTALDGVDDQRDAVVPELPKNLRR